MTNEKNSRSKKLLFLNKLNTKELLPGVLAVLCLSFMVFVYAPYELYLTNQQDFWFTSSMLLKPTLLLFLAVFIAGSVAMVIAKLISGKLYNLLVAAVLVALAATYVQGTFLVSGLPPMDGTTYDWSQASPERIKSIAAWVIPAAAVVFVCIKFRGKGIKTASTFVSAALLFMLVTSFVSLLFVDKQEAVVSSDEILVCSDKDLYQMSEDQNLVVLVLDGTDNTKFFDALQKDPDYASAFDGFTYYNNVLSGYVYTKESFPFILSGEWYENDEPFLEYQNRVISESPLITALEARDYSIGLYATFNDRLKTDIFSDRFDNYLEHGPYFKDMLSASKVVIRMAGIRYAPWDLKRFMYDLDWTVSAAQGLVDDHSFYSWENDVFYRHISEDQPFEMVEEKNCRIIHLIGAHTPFKYDSEVHRIPEKEGTYEQSIDACVTICKEYFRALKDNGLYDNTAIAIIADHGLVVGRENHFIGRTNPILLVKGINEHHDMTVSAAPISQEDYASSFVKLLDGNNGGDIFDYKEGDYRERRLLLYEYLDEAHMHEYVVTGLASDLSSFTPTGNHYYADED